MINPIINILIRTSSRPNFFHNCINSVLSQSYKNLNVIVGVDNDNSFEYVSKFPVKLIKYNYDHVTPYSPPIGNYGEWFVPNLYMNNLHSYVEEGHILYLDDDNLLVDNSSIQTIVDNIVSNNDLLFWRIQFPKDRVIPCDEHFYNRPILYDIDSAGFLIPTTRRKYWEPFRLADFRLIDSLYDEVKNKIYIDKILTATQKHQLSYNTTDDRDIKRIY
jgi:hypothetical protein